MALGRFEVRVPMRFRIWVSAFRILPLCLLCAIVSPLSTGAGQMGRVPGCGRGALNCGPSAGPGASAAEAADFHAFDAEPVVEKKIALGEAFDQHYPHSPYAEQVDTELSFLYFNDGDYAKFYAATDRVIALNPKSVSILELVGWLIPRRYDANAPDAAARLDQAEKYEKRALQIVAAMRRPHGVTPAEFANSQTSLTWRAHSGLGTVDFRRKDFADSAAELQLALKQEGTGPDPTDLYLLGIDFEKLGRTSDAADDFSQCSVISGGMQQQCRQAYEEASHAAAETVEEKAFDAFMDTPNPDTQIQLGEKFDATYPSSNYEENVDAALVILYADKQDWNKFYATAAKVLARDADNVPVLTVLGWIIPRRADMDAPGGAEKLGQAEQYEKHALDVIANMKQPANLTADEFAQAKTDALFRAHSGLGATYFREHHYADSAKELQLATAAGTDADEFDYYVLGVDLHQLNQPREAADAFAKCAGLPGYLQAQCKRDADFSSQAAAQLVAVAAKPSNAASNEAVSVDIPPSITQQASAPIKAETIVVPVRVIVRDNKGHAIADLTKENFKLYQDGKPQEVVNFTAVGENGPKDSASHAVSPALSPSAGGEPASGGSTAASPARFIVLFFDDVHLYFIDIAEIRNAAQKYLASLQPEDRVAIVTASGQGAADFTSDRDKLHSTIAKLLPHPFPGGSTAPVPQSPCPPAMTYTEASAISEEGSNQVLAAAGGDFVVCDHIVAEDPQVALEIGESHARMVSAQAHIAGEEAISAVFDELRNTVRHLAVMPGQRIVVLVSPGFLYGTHAAEFADISDLAIRDNVVINSLDAKGIYGFDGKWNPDRFRLAGYGHETELEALQDLADATGGLFIHFDNDFAGAMREMSEPPEAYYLLGYAPQNLQPDGKFHVLKVSLTAGAHGEVQARRGFFAPSHLETPQEAAKREIQDALFSDEVQHDLPVRMETSLTRGPSGSETLGVKAHVDASQLRFVKAGSTNQEELTVSAALFDADGNYVTGTQKVAQMNFDDSTLAQTEKTGFYLELDFNPKPGSYMLRMVTRDSNDGRISAQNADVTVPN